MCRVGWILLVCLLTGCSTHPVADMLDYFAPGKMGPNEVPPYGGVGIPQGAIVPPAAVVPGGVVPGGVIPPPVVPPPVVPPPAPLPSVRPPGFQLQPPTPGDVPPPLPPNPPNFPR